MVYVQPRIYPGKRDAQTYLGFWYIKVLSNFGQTTRCSNNQPKKENLLNNRFCHSSWPQSKTEGKWKERLVPRPYKRTKKL